MNYVATNNDAIEVLKRNKLIDVYVDLLTTKIYHLRTQTDYEKRKEIEDIILELIAMLRDV